MNWLSFFAVGGGAFAGAVLRWVFGFWFNPLFPLLPVGTLLANLVGAFIMGLAMGIFSQYQGIPLEIRLLVTTGFLGGLTTFSAFSAEAVGLLLRQHYAWAIGMISAHVFGSLLMTFAGFFLVRLAIRS